MLPARLQAAGVPSPGPNPQGSPSYQALEGQVATLDAAVFKLRNEVGSLQGEVDSLKSQLSALSKLVGGLPKVPADFDLRVAFCNHNHIVEYNNRDQGTFGLIDNRTAQRPAICSI
jgi:hypothetical protein